ncbi:MAG: GNAT family N-acetyltransferase [Vicingaceae bacterium]|nr:GNAT family N-acetyltransferase [Vicingaceae bacterium]
MNNKAQIIVNHHFDLYRELATDSRVIGNVEFSLTPNNSFPNFIFNENENVDIKSIQKKIESSGLPPFWITPNIEFTKVLNQNGFKLLRAWPLLIMEDKELTAPKTVKGFELEKVILESDLHSWKQIVEDEYKYHFTIETLKKWLANPKVDLFIGKIDNEPVSSILNFTTDNIVGGHLVATSSNYRNQGIGSQTFYSALQDAFEKGCEFGIASSTELGLNAWKKIGYTILDDKLYINWLLGKMI